VRCRTHLDELIAIGHKRIDSAADRLAGLAARVRARQGGDDDKVDLRSLGNR
jgi:hypothetical protein